MKDEELAEEYAKEEVPFDTTESGEKLYTEHDLKHAFLAGLKAARAEQWHDLKKNPDDLPKDEKDMLMSNQLNLLIKMKGSDALSLALGQYNFSAQEFCYQHIVGLTEVIAWKEIVLPDAVDR